MKQSHLTTPRTMAECHFQTGYRPAEPRDWFADFGHLVLNFVCAIALLMLVPAFVLGVF